MGLQNSEEFFASLRIQTQIQICLIDKNGKFPQKSVWCLVDKMENFMSENPDSNPDKNLGSKIFPRVTKYFEPGLAELRSPICLEKAFGAYQNRNELYFGIWSKFSCLTDTKF